MFVVAGIQGDGCDMSRVIATALGNKPPLALYLSSLPYSLLIHPNPFCLDTSYLSEPERSL